MWPLKSGFGTLNPRLVAWPLKLGFGTQNTRFVAWLLKLGLGTQNPCFVAWSLQLGFGTQYPCFHALLWGPEELIVLVEGEGAFWDNKRKFRWTQPETKQVRKKLRTAPRDALQGDRGEEGGTVPAPPKRRVEEDDFEASVALQRGSDQR